MAAAAAAATAAAPDADSIARPLGRSSHQTAAEAEAEYQQVLAEAWGWSELDMKLDMMHFRRSQSSEEELLRVGLEPEEIVTTPELLRSAMAPPLYPSPPRLRTHAAQEATAAMVSNARSAGNGNVGRRNCHTSR